jgi:hypothetical protein
MRIELETINETGADYRRYTVEVTATTKDGWWGTTAGMDAVGAGAILWPYFAWHSVGLSTIQRAALAILSKRNVGCVYIGEPRTGRYVWPEDIRNSEQLACDVVNHYQKSELAQFTSLSR